MLQKSDLPILDPSTLISRYGSHQAAFFLQSVNDEVYIGEGVCADSHNYLQYQQGIEDKTLFPFLVLENDHPIASYTATLIGEKARMGDAAVVPRLRGQGVGKQLYFYAHQWVEKNLFSKIAFIAGADLLQEVLLRVRFTFAGIYPGIISMDVIRKDNVYVSFSRQAAHVFGALRPNIIPTLVVPTVPTLKNSQLQEVAEAICLNWRKNQIQI